MGTKRESRQPISTELHGRTHTGEVVIRGTRELEFCVEYNGERESDGRRYGTGPAERHDLLLMAELILMRMINHSERVPGRSQAR